MYLSETLDRGNVCLACPKVYNLCRTPLRPKPVLIVEVYSFRRLLCIDFNLSHCVIRKGSFIASILYWRFHFYMIYYVSSFRVMERLCMPSMGSLGFHVRRQLV